MSPRVLGSGMSAAVTAVSGERVHLLAITTGRGTVYLSTGATDLTWDSHTWEAVGGALTIGGIQEAGTDVQGVDVELSGVDQTVLSALMTNGYRGQFVSVYLAALDAATGDVLDALEVFRGYQLQPYTVTETRDRTGGGVTIKTTWQPMAAWTQVRGIQANLASHGHAFPGDTFFQNTPGLAGRLIYWGTDRPAIPAMPPAGHGGGRPGQSDGTHGTRPGAT